MLAVFFGGNLAFSVIVFGWLPITFGLGFGSAIAASAVGIGLGTLLIAPPLSLLGPRTGTNNTVSSGAHFGVSGRMIGSGSHCSSPSRTPRSRSGPRVTR